MRSGVITYTKYHTCYSSDSLASLENKANMKILIKLCELFAQEYVQP